jgi:hypothetical protein
MKTKRQIWERIQQKEKKKTETMIGYKYPSIASGATCAIVYFSLTTKLQLHCRQNKGVLLPSGAILSIKEQLEYLVYSNSQTKPWHINSRVASLRQNSNAMIETYREGKTPGSVLCGLVYARECALLVIIHVYDAKKILVDALGTLRTIRTRSL